MKLLAISGSARSASTNTALLQVLAEVSPKDIDITVFHNLQTLPVFSPDLEGANTPSEIISFVDAIDLADGVIISSPEYVRAIPGGLKNAIDWLVSGKAIIDKPVALIHCSHRGDDMLASLRLVLNTVTSAFHEQIFQRFPLISKSPEEVRGFLSRKENTERLESYIAELSGAIMKNATEAPRAGLKSTGYLDIS
jgi:NAD(P)H-dependent FMN reductase